MLSDLNKHMRTVHHTYRRKAKIPKDMISELADNPDLGLQPQIYGAKPAKQPSPTTAAAAAMTTTVVPASAMQSSLPPAAPSSVVDSHGASPQKALTKVVGPTVSVAAAAKPLLPPKTAKALPPLVHVSALLGGPAVVPVKAMKAAGGTVAAAKWRSDGGDMVASCGRDPSLEAIKQELGKKFFALMIPYLPPNYLGTLHTVCPLYIPMYVRIQGFLVKKVVEFSF